MISNRCWCAGSENIMWQGDKAKSWGERTQEDQLVASSVLKAEWSARCCLPAKHALAQTTSADKQSSQHGGRFSGAGETALGLRVLVLSQDLNWSPAPPSGDWQLPNSSSRESHTLKRGQGRGHVGTINWLHTQLHSQFNTEHGCWVNVNLILEAT